MNFLSFNFLNISYFEIEILYLLLIPVYTSMVYGNRPESPSILCHLQDALNQYVFYFRLRAIISLLVLVLLHIALAFKCQ